MNGVCDECLKAIVLNARQRGERRNAITPPDKAWALADQHGGCSVCAAAALYQLSREQVIEKLRSQSR